MKDKSSDLSFANWPKRAAALLVDFLIIFFLYVGVLIIFNIVLNLIFLGLGLFVSDGSTLSDFLASTLVILTAIVIYLGFFIVIASYYSITMSRSGDKNGQSLGKEIFSIKVIREDGQEISKQYALKRQLLIITLLFNLLLGVITVFIAPAINYLWPLQDKNNQALHDKLAKSFVIESF